MGIFLDISERSQRCVSLANQAQLYYDLHNKQAKSCESSAKRLFAAVETIANAQGKTLTQALGLPGGIENAVFEGGFEYHGLESVGKTISFSQWFVFASTIGSGGLYIGAHGHEQCQSVNAIYVLASLRLDTCAHELMMEVVSKCISEFAIQAEVYAKNPKIASSFDIPKEFSAVTQALIKKFEDVHRQALVTLKKNDLAQQAYTVDDPNLAGHVFDLTNAAPSKIIQLDISSDFAVDWLQTHTDHGDGVRFGGDGGTMKVNKVKDGELITSATWKTGTLAADSTKKVIFNLTIVTSKRSLGPFGTGGDKIKADDKEQGFNVPDKFNVCGLMDAASEVVEDELGNATILHQPYISELRFVIAPTN